MYCIVYIVTNTWYNICKPASLLGICSFFAPIDRVRYVYRGGRKEHSALRVRGSLVQIFKSQPCLAFTVSIYRLVSTTGKPTIVWTTGSNAFESNRNFHKKRHTPRCDVDISSHFVTVLYSSFHKLRGGQVVNSFIDHYVIF